MESSRFVSCALALAVLATGQLAAAAPITVSPGSVQQVTVIRDQCPTFSWGAVAGAPGYELVVYLIGEEAEPVLKHRIPSSALSWTPGLSDCLELGGRYAWSIRAIHGGEAGAWSQPSLFQVAPEPTRAQFQEALDIVKRYLTTTSEEDAGAGAERRLEASKDHPHPSTPEPLAPAQTKLSVDGNVAATTFTGDGSNLAGVATDSELATHAGVADVHHTPTVDTDTTCTGATCDGTNFTNVTAVAGDSATAFFSSGQIEEPRIAAEIARDSEVTALGGSVWSQNGNAGTDATINFLGTTDDEPLELRTNSTSLLRLALDSVSHPGASTNTPIDIPDNAPPGVSDSISVADFGTAVSLSVSLNLTNSDISTIRVELTAPDASPYVLYDGGSTGTSLNTSFPSPTATVSGDLTTWMGSNPSGIWTIKVIDSGFLNNGFDGQLLAWSINFDTLTDPNVQVLSRLEVNGNLSVGEVAASGMVSAPMFSGDGSNLAGVATDAELVTHEGVTDAHFDHADTLAELNTQTGASLADGPHTIDTDTTCTGAACDGSNFTNVTAVAGDSATAFFSTGQIEDARIPAGIARDAELPVVFPFSGWVGNTISSSSTSYVFAGPTTSVTITVGQRLTGAATAILGTSSASPAFRFGLCYQLGAGTVTNFAGPNYTQITPAGGDEASYSATASIQPASGTYTVGFCVRNTGSVDLDDNDYMNGWVMVTG